MLISRIFRRLSCFLLAVCFFLSLLGSCLKVSASEAAVPSESSPPETTVPTETARATEPTLPETVPVTEPSLPEETLSVFAEEEPLFFSPYTPRFGLLHAHTDLSSGTGSVTEAFSHASQVAGLDFFAVTDHSSSFDNAGSGALNRDGRDLSAAWAAGKAAAEAVTTETFLGLFGYEMSWPEDKQLGHITTFGTPGWQTWTQKGFVQSASALEAYYKALLSCPGSVSQFCHPGNVYGTFRQFQNHRPEYDDAIQLLEVGSGEEGTFFSQYTQALDAGWQVAPSINQNNHHGLWGDADEGRTVVLAEELTERNLLEAIRARRVYATQDRDLHLYFHLNGCDMGSVLPGAADPDLFLSIWDPTDQQVGLVQVITEGGQILASQDLTEQAAEISFSLPAGFRYYYLRITQPDGDMAVTAPVWVDLGPQLGISSLLADTDAPDQGEGFQVSLSLFNDSREPFAPEAVELYLGETQLQAVKEPGSVPAGGTSVYSFSHTHPEAGVITLRAVVRGKGQSFEETLTLTIQPRETITGLLIDGSHQNAGLDTLDQLKLLAAEAGQIVTVFSQRMPRGGDLLLIPPPGSDLDRAFIEDVLDFLKSGGSLILWGSGVNPLLEAVGSSLRVGTEGIDAGVTKTFQAQAPWCRDLAEGQYFSFGDGFAVTGGAWLVKSGNHTILACEETPCGGTIFLSGCTLFPDDALTAPESVWELPRANRTILRSILGIGVPVLPITDMENVRKGTIGTVYRVKGHVTAGTANPHTTFPDAIYLQDDTGGIAVTNAAIPDLPVGTPVELTGTLALDGENLVLDYREHHIPPEWHFRYTPEITACQSAMNYADYGGELMQVEGTVTELTKTEDQKGLSRLVVEDFLGNSAVIEIEEGIGTGPSGENKLAKTIRKGRVARAMGLLHINEDGETVLRVRNCEEVVYVPPRPDPTNPDTGDWLWFLFS